MHSCVCDDLRRMTVKGSLVPRPPPSFPSLAVLYRTASDGKLGGGLGTRLCERRRVPPCTLACVMTSDG